MVRIIMAVCALFVVSCTGGSSNDGLPPGAPALIIAPSTAETASVRGIVTDITGKPIAGVRVTAAFDAQFIEDRAHAKSEAVTRAEDGAYTLSGILPMKTYDVIFTHPGYVVWRMQFAVGDQHSGKTATQPTAVLFPLPAQDGVFVIDRGAGNSLEGIAAGRLRPFANEDNERIAAKLTRNPASSIAVVSEDYQISGTEGQRPPVSLWVGRTPSPPHVVECRGGVAGILVVFDGASVEPTVYEVSEEDEQHTFRASKKLGMKIARTGGIGHFISEERTAAVLFAGELRGEGLYGLLAPDGHTMHLFRVVR